MGARQVFGAALTVVGMLVAVLSPFLSIVVIVVCIFRRDAGGWVLPFTLLSGGLWTPFGLVIFWVGLALMREQGPPQPPTEASK